MKQIKMIQGHRLRRLLRPAWLAGMLALTVGVDSARAATQFVRMVNFAFQPQFLTNNAGDTVVWTNTTLSLHNTVSSNGLWSVPTFASPGTFAFTFTNAGTYGYYCSPHLSFGMTGIIYTKGPPNNPPTVAITDPTNNATFVAPATITLRATASDPGGAVTNVQFFRGANLLGSDSVSPFELVLNSLTSRTYNFTARAFDNGGAVSTSAVVSVSVIDLSFGTNLVFAGANLPVTLHVTPGLSYAVEASSNLLTWAVVTNFTAATNSFSFSSPKSGFLRRFFRARLASGP
jgi:plastocyanin